jgi:hypothetical protein
MLLRNSGTPSQPEFSIITSDFAELGKYGFEGVYPTFGDMDGDGDGDMIIGDEQGKLHYFENGAPTGHPASFILEQPNYQGIDIGQSAKPQIVDVNRDGLPDLLVGERSGTVKYFENTGSPVAPEFGSLPSVDQFGDIDVMPECCTGYSAPFMTEDSLGHYQLYVGSEQGLVYLFGNIENNLTGTFTLIDSLYLYGVNVNLSGADINGDGKLEFVYGELAGGIGLLKDGIPHNLGTEELSVSNELIKIFPNPVKDLLSIEIPERFNGLPYEISILNMMGQKVYYGYQISEESLFPFNVENFTDGIYLIVISIHDQVHTGKFIKR